MKTFIFLLGLLVYFYSYGQIKQRINWNIEVVKKSDNEYTLLFKAKPDKDWHFYSINDKLNPLIFNFKKNEKYSLKGKIQESPKAKTEYDEIMESERSYFEKEATYSQSIVIKSDQPFNIEGSIEYQACFLDGMCVMEEYDFNIPFQPESVKNQANDSALALKKDSSNNISQANNDSISKSIISPSINEVSESKSSNGKGSLWWLFIFSFLAGLAAILTPCVFPMIPMTVSFFMHNDNNKRKAKFQAIVYGISIILIYTIIGTIVAITLGANFANFLSTHWLPNIFFFLIFVVFAASFFGMFELVLPSWMISKVDQKAEKGGVLGPFFMAFTLVLVSFSCTGPIVGAILVKSAGGEVVEPIIGMLGFSLAFALPFTFFAFFPSLLKNLPKSGGWLNSVKVVLGFLELALGLKFLSVADQTYHWGILDREVYLAFWIVIFGLMGFYLLGKLKFPHDSEVKHISVPRLIFAIITFAFVVYMIPGLWGAPLKALSGYLPPQSTLDFDINNIVRENNYSSNPISSNKDLCEKPKYAEFLHLPHGLKGYFDYEQALKCAKEQNKPLFIDFTGHGCVNCREMEANVWSHPEVLKRLKENFIIVALYVDDKTELPENEWIVSKVDGKIKKSIGKKYADFQISRFKVNAQPYYVLLDENGELLVEPKAYDLNVDNFIQFLDKGMEEFHKRKAN
ncbi:MAG: thioredoxin family protein [Bacteroidales bacterium]|nr:thioredoxin family protein [Bacteroidales bacterium]